MKLLLGYIAICATTGIMVTVFRSLYLLALAVQFLVRSFS